MAITMCHVIMLKGKHRQQHAFRAGRLGRRDRAAIEAGELMTKRISKRKLENLSEWRLNLQIGSAG